MVKFQIQLIGKHAAVLMENADQLTIMGQTSSGLFLKVNQQDIIFISASQIPGPLTLNMELEVDFKQLPVLNPDTQLTFAQGKMVFSNFPQFVISLNNPKVWSVLPPSLSRPDDIQVLNRLIGALNYLINQNDSSSLLDALFAKEAYEELPGNIWKEKLDDIRYSFFEMDWSWLKAQLEAFIGVGPGLTPSGDDFVLGFLFALNRFPSHFEDEWLDKINNDVVLAAGEKTNSISAGLIRCAAEGQADQRLVQAIDDMVLTVKPIEESVSPLLEWGSSSGCDAFVGMYFALELIVGIKMD